MKTVEQRMIERIKDGEINPVDREGVFRDCLDEIYSFKSVGGPFAHMTPSAVLKEMDPVAFRCGVNAFIDGDDRIEEFEGDDYWKEELDTLREECQDEYDEELAALEEQAAEDKAEANATRQL